MLCQLAFIRCGNGSGSVGAFDRPDRAGSRHRAARRWTREPKTFGRALPPIAARKPSPQAISSSAGRLRPARPTARRAALAARLTSGSYDPRLVCALVDLELPCEAPWHGLAVRGARRA